MSSNFPENLQNLMTPLINRIEATPQEELLGYAIVALLLLISIVWIITVRHKKRGQKKPSLRKTQPTASQKLSTESILVDQATKTLSDIEDIKALDDQQWLVKLQNGLAKTRSQFTSRLSSIFSSSKPLNEEVLEELHETLFRSDLGVATTEKLVRHIEHRFRKTTDEPITWETVESSLREKIREILERNSTPIQFNPSGGPTVILIVGVNGVGKTTSIGKLAAHFLAHDKKVLLAAADTYRAGAIDQLGVWAQRLGCEMIKHQPGADPASVAYDAVKAAIARDSDILLIDTAGRLHSKKELMDELAKIKRVIGKDLPDAPHETWIVVDATTGQNAYQQLAAFSEVTPLSGIIVTKLDGTAKGGVVIGASDRFSLPIRYIGVGEKAADLRQFNASDFASMVL